MGTLAAFWGLAGAISILAYATFRMCQHTTEAVSYPWGIQHYVVFVLWTAMMAYSEGYRGFQRGYSPRTASRAVYLRDHSTPIRVVLAPLFCMGFFAAPRRRQITVVVLMLLIAAIAFSFQYIPQPWRGILDVGVIVGLSWGILSTLYFFFRFWNSPELLFDPEVIESDQSTAPS